MWGSGMGTQNHTVGRGVGDVAGEQGRRCQTHHWAEEGCLVLKAMKMLLFASKELRGVTKHLFWSAH